MWYGFAAEAIPPLDDADHAAYKAGDDADIGDYLSNYLPGALTISSRRDKAYEPSRRP